MVGRARTVAVVGLDPVAVTVEAHLGPGLPGLHVIGSSGSAAREAGERVKTALAASGLTLPQLKQLVSLAPAEVPKAGARFDLAMALALAAAAGVLPEGALQRTAAIGELALDGAVRGVPGVLPSVGALPGLGVDRVLVADANAGEAALVGGVTVTPVASLREALDVLGGAGRPRRVPTGELGSPPCDVPDLADVRGQAEARRALELAAAGGHHVLLVGPPGCGKSMLAARLPGLLPPLDRAGALEVAAVRSIAGAVAPGEPLLDRRPPLRAPHHSTTASALLGGGSAVARPGEISRAHRGVLFLDELFEWPRALLDALREPLEEGVVRLARARATVRYPARFQLVCAANPCPCGGGERCSCTDDVIARYRGKLSGPLADRLDLAPAVEPVTAADLLDDAPVESTAAVAVRVARARERAASRWGEGAVNVRAPAAAVRRTADRASLRVLADALDRGVLTGRGFDRALRVARTIADLDGVDVVGRQHALEALAHRIPLAAGAAAGAASDGARTPLAGVPA
jgi:magnesium chelatase family protein